MDLKYLITFKAILDEGSYLKAAEKLNYTQSTVTFQIHQLEQVLSTRLFEKIGRRMALTQAGREVLPLIDELLQSVDKLLTYGKSAAEIKGMLKVAIPETLLTYQMQSVLKAFRTAASGVTLKLQTPNCYRIRDQITSGEVDVGVHYDVGGYGNTVVTERIAEYPLCMIASPELPAAESDFCTAHRQRDTSLIYSDGGSVTFKEISSYLSAKDISVAGYMELGSTEALKRSVSANLGVALVPSFTVSEELERGALKTLPTELNPGKVTVMCSYHKNKWISPAMELFIRLVKENFA